MGIGDTHRQVRRLLSIIVLAFGLMGCAASGGLTRDEQLDALLAQVKSSDDVPGAILVLDAPGAPYAAAVGFADRDAKTAMEVGSTLRIASVTKTYVAALTIKIAQSGALDLDAPVSTYLGEDVLSKLPSGLDPTIRQLLNHTSGIPDYYSVRFYEEDWNRTQPLTPELVLHAIRGLPATVEPGSGFSYSNTGYHVAALALEAAAGKPLGDLLQENIFTPLELTSTYYGEAFPPGDVIRGYGSPFDDWEATYQYRENSGPDGGAFASASDLTTWIRALFAPDGAFSAIGAEMTAAPVHERERKLQGLGVEILTSRSGVQVFGHTGSNDGYLTAAFYVPEADTVLVLHINRSDEEAFAYLLSETLKIVMSTAT